MYTHVIHTIPIPNSNPFNNNDNEQQLRCCIPTTSCQCNEPPESTVTRHSLFVTLYFPLLVARYSLLFVMYLSRIAFILFVALLLPCCCPLNCAIVSRSQIKSSYSSARQLSKRPNNSQYSHLMPNHNRIWNTLTKIELTLTFGNSNNCLLKLCTNVCLVLYSRLSLL